MYNEKAVNKAIEDYMADPINSHFDNQTVATDILAWIMLKNRGLSINIKDNETKEIFDTITIVLEEGDKTLLIGEHGIDRNIELNGKKGTLFIAFENE